MELSGNKVIASYYSSKEKEYWINKLDNTTEKSSFYYDYNQYLTSQPCFCSVNFEVSKESCNRLNEISKGSDYQLFMICTAVLSELLRRYTNKQDIQIGTSIFEAKPNEEYLNTALVLKHKINGRITYKELLLEIVSPTIREAIEHQNYPIEAIIHELYPEVDFHNPLFDVAIILENIQNQKLLSQSSYNILFIFNKKDNGISGSIYYNSKKYKQDSVERIIKHYNSLLKQCINSPSVPLHQHSLLDIYEQKVILESFNTTNTPYPQYSVNDLFKEGAKKYPNRIAIIYKNESITYEELDKKSDKLASYLENTGVKNGEVIAIQSECSIEMIIGILGILKAGGMYVPLNTDYPSNRVKLLLNDCNINFILLVKECEEYKKEIVKINLKDERLYKLNKSTKPFCRNKNTDGAYIMYTSGSTGIPKGVLVEHRSIIRLVRSNNYFSFQESNRILQTGALEFDASTFEIWSPLLNNGTLCLADKDDLITIDKLDNLIKRYQIDTLWLTASLFNHIIELKAEMFCNTKHLIVGGDRLSPFHINKLRQKFSNITIINGYGPTENTTFSTTFKIDRNYADNIPIGTPISNSTAYILDEDKNLSPIGGLGELCVGGDGLSKGYVNNPELTNEKFIFLNGLLNQRLYKTGDLARWLNDGNMDFVGRKDTQIKIRGYRVEPSEIENKLLCVKGVKEASVIVKEFDGGDKRLCAYLVCEDEITNLFVIEYLKNSLPEYMIPSYFTRLNELPLTSNGKLNKKALPEPEVNELSYIAPRNEIEKKLVTIWSENIGIPSDKIGIDCNYFDIGGHSLKATLLVNQLHKEFDVKIPLKDIFKAQTLREQAFCIEQKSKEKYTSIPKASPKQFYKTSSAQKRIYILQQMEPDMFVYNIPLTVILEGEIKKEKIKLVFEKLITRQESLRTSFETIDNELVQIIHESVEFDLEEVSQTDSEAKIIKEFVRPFNLAIAPLVRAGIKKIDNNKYLLIIDIHHIITDGTSMSLIAKEFIDLYNDKNLPETKLTYKDFSEWQNEQIKSGSLSSQQKFWLNQFNNDELPVLSLPYDYPRPLFQSYEGDTISFTINKNLTRDIKQLSGEHGTLFMVILAIYHIFLSKLSGQEHIIVGVPIAGRRHADTADVIGLFINTLAIQSKPEEDKNFKDYLKEIIDYTIEVFDNQDYQFEDLIENLRLERDTSRNPLFSAAFSFHNEIDPEEITNIKTTNINLRPYSTNIDYMTSKFDLTLSGKELKDELHFNFEYSTKLFRKETLERFASYFKKLVSTILLDTNVKLSDIEIIPNEEKLQLLSLFDNTIASYPKNKTIVDLFDEQVDKTPNSIAIKFYNENITYLELDKRTNHLAVLIREKGIIADDVVGLLMDRSIDTIIGMLSILKAGGAYLSIDVDYPTERIDYIIKNSKVSLILTSKRLKSDISVQVPKIFIEESAIEQGTKHRIERINKPSDLCYVIYTSGTTGNPKGVMVEHSNVVRLFFSDQFQFDFGHKDVWTMFHSHCFDFSVWEIYGALLFGGTLIIIPKMIARDNMEYLKLLKKERVTVLNQTPTSFYNLIRADLEDADTGLQLRYVIFGGEALSPIKLKRWKNKYPQVKLINMFGITETTVHVTYKEIKELEIDNNISNIGRPIPTLSVYVLDKKQRLAPRGVVGELYVGGSGVSRGYLYNEELTNERFITNPYKPGEKLYRSGDKVRILWSGDIEYLGRIDNQIQLRGFRIELGEIETQMNAFDTISETIVLQKEKDGNDYLVAYYVSRHEIEGSKLRDYLSGKLPDYMVPSYFVYLDSIPLTTNGKLDPKALPDPEIKAGEDYIAPSNEIEKTLVKLWSEVLKIDKDKISVTRSFFDLGGHSLNATLLVNKIIKELNVHIPLRDIFKYQDIKNISKLIQKSDKTNYHSISKAAPKDYFALSSAQKRLFFLYEFDNNSLAYNMPNVVKLEGDLDRVRLSNTFNKLIARHESLHTSFEIIDGEVLQKISNQFNLDVEYFHSSPDKVQSIIHQFIRPFDLRKAPLIRVGLIEILTHVYILIVDMHHIISDGVSQGILINEFMTYYNHKELPELALQYKDYAEWQQGDEQQKILTNAKNFWLNEFKEVPSVLHLPTDYPRPLIKSFEGDTVNFDISIEETLKLKKIANKEGVTLFMLLLSAYYVLLSKLSNQEDVVIGTPIAGRHHTDLEQIIGIFINSLPLRNYPKSNLSFKEFLSDVKSKTLACFNNQSYPYESIIDNLKIERNTSRNPLFDIMFVFQNFEKAELTMPGFKIDSYKSGHVVSKFDLTLTAVDSSKQIFLGFEYSTALFNKSTIDKIVTHFKKILITIIKDINVRLSDIEILTDEEKHILLHEFNNTTTDYPKDKTVIDFFKIQVDTFPENIALRYGNETMTYLQLWNKSDQICLYMQETCNVKVGDLVGLMLEREEYLIPSIFGILKAGAAYIPIDPNYPKDRILSIVEDSQIKTLITRGKYLNTIEIASCILDLDKCGESINDMQLKPIEVKVSSENLAYVIYTSGSTGKPKGVMIEHHSITNRILWMQKAFPINNEDVLLQKTPIVFDVSVWELFWWSFVGASLCLLEQGGEKEPNVIIETINKHKVTTVHFVPTMLGAFLSVLEDEYNYIKLKSLQLLFASGEELKVDQVHLFGKTLNKNCNTRLINLYGPTEATVDVSYFECDFSKECTCVPIGKPIDNIRLYILNNSMKLSQIKVPGELYIAGAGLARGYLHNNELTKEKFVDNPFEFGERIYKTGDMARWLPDGNIEYLGRLDDQVKIRGFRIELGEIEYWMMKFENIKKAIALVKKYSQTDTRIIGFYLANAPVPMLKYRKFLREHLPDYMVPSIIIHLEDIPITINGKIDKSVLLKKHDEHLDSNTQTKRQPQSELELSIAKVWAETLGTQNIGLDDNYFEIGGNSIKLIETVYKLKEIYGTKPEQIDIYGNTLEQFSIKYGAMLGF